MKRSGVLLFLCAILVVVAAVACGSGDKQPAATPSTAASSGHEADALTRSSASVSSASSFSAEFHATIRNGVKTLPESGTLAFQAPSSVDFKMSVLGDDIEVLAVPPDEYMKVGGEWYDLGDAVINRDAYAAYAKNRGPVDYAGILSTLKHPQQLPDATIDGVTYEHYSGTFNISDELDKIPQDVFKPGVADLTKGLLDQDGQIEVWIDGATGLPRRFVMDMTIDIRGSTFSSRTTMDYTTWNERVDIPPAPTNAKPYSDLTGG
jgi:outer membrane lipoprotein-sorting protein